MELRELCCLSER